MAAQKIEQGFVQGQLVKAERNNGNFTGGDGGAVAFDYWELKVLTPEYDVCILRVPSDAAGRPALTVPPTGTSITAAVEYRAAGGNVKATVKAFIDADELAAV